MQDRLLFFDILRIISIFSIVFFHISQYIVFKPFDTEYLFLNTFYIGLGPIAVFFMIFISGAVIEYSYSKPVDKKTKNSHIRTSTLVSYTDYIKFYLKRFARLYPAFWITLGMSLLLQTIVLRGNFDTFMQAMGMYVYLGKWGGPINVIGWFIGVIIALYLMYPFLSKLVRKYPTPSIIISFIGSFGSMYIINVFFQPHLTQMTLICRWFPTVNIFAFVLGIFIIQRGIYPKTSHKSAILTYIAELSFYIFLLHNIFWRTIYRKPSGLPAYIMVVTMFAIALMCIDKTIQYKLNKYLK